MKYYKVVTQNLQSLGLRNNPTILTFPIGVSVVEPYKVFRDKRDNGGIWVANGLGNANSIKKYNVRCRVFTCSIGEVLFQNSYRTKTDVVTLLEEVH